MNPNGPQRKCAQSAWSLDSSKSEIMTMKRSYFQIALVAALGCVITGCTGGAADNTNGGELKGGAPISTGANTKSTKHSMVGVRTGLFSAGPGQKPGIPK